jgi:DNA polymerase-3 subunit epsilon
MRLRELRRWWHSRSSRSPYEEPELVSLDLETSSLDPRTAEILSLAAVPVRGRRVLTSECFERVVRGTATVDPEAVKYHRLRPVDVEHGIPAGQAARELREWLGERPVIGYCIGFDCGMLERALGAAGDEDIYCTSFDLRDIYRRVEMRRNPDASPSLALDDILSALGVPAVARHTALGDATAVAMAFLALKYGVRVAASSSPRPAGARA